MSALIVYLPNPDHMTRVPVQFVVHPYGPSPYHYPAAWGEAMGLPSPEALDRRHGDTGGRLLSDDEDPIPGVRERKG